MDRERQKFEDCLGPVFCRLPFFSFDGNDKFVAKTMNLREWNSFGVDMIGNQRTVPRWKTEALAESATASSILFEDARM